jgi:hypothetical protein
MLKYFDNGNREEFFHLWSEHIPINIIDTDSSLKSLEFLLYTHFAIYYLRPNKFSNEQLANENMRVFKSYIESIKGQPISQTNDILPLFALPYVTAPENHASFKDLFSVCIQFEIGRNFIGFLLGSMVSIVTIETIDIF